jgi:uncharacterized protein (DUF2252 family)
MPTPLARQRAHDAGRIPQMLVRKYALMRRSPFVFLRGSCRMFYEDLAAVRDRALDDSPLAWGCGDLHFENFGSYKGDNRLTYFDLNDFDDGALSHATWELVRFAASVIVAAPEFDLAPRDALTQAGAFIDAHQRALAAGRARWVERDTATGVVRALLDRERSRKRKQLLRRRTVGEGPARRLLVDGDRMTPALRADITRVRELVQSLTPPADAPRFYNVLDVAHRVAGTGSLGVRRFAVLVVGRGREKAYLLDLKQSAPSALGALGGVQQPAWTTEAARVVAVQERVQAVSPALLRTVRIAGHAFVLRELQPREDRVDIAEWCDRPHLLTGVMETFGEIVASGRLRASGRQGAAVADELIAFGNDRTVRRRVLDAARAAAARVERQHADFVAELNDEGLVAVPSLKRRRPS